MSQHIVSIKVYVTIFLALLVFTALTVQAAFIDLGPLNLIVAMTIAMIKAVIVALYFMHVRYSSHLTKLFVSAGVVWLAILLAMISADYLSRDWAPQPQGWEVQGQAAVPPAADASNPH